MTVKNRLIAIGTSFVGVLLIATLIYGVIDKRQRTEEILSQKQLQTEEIEAAKAAEAERAAASSSQYEVPPIKIDTPEIAAAKKELAKQKAAASSSAPELTVSTDESGNQTVTEEYSKPAQDASSQSQANSTPEQSTSSKAADDGGIKYDENGNQIPNEKGEIFLPGFGWTKSTGGKSIPIHNAGTGDVIGY